MLMMLPSCLVKCVQPLGPLVLHAWRLGGFCGRKYTQRILMMTHDAPLLLRQMRAITRAVGFATLASRRVLWPEIYPADAHDKMLPVTGIKPADAHDAHA